MRPILLLTAALLAATPAAAQAPLKLNLGSGPNSRDAAPIRTLFQQIQDAINGLQVGGGVSLSGVQPLSVLYAGNPNPNAVLFGSGNSVSFCPALSCVLSPSVDHQRTSALFSAVTQDDGHSQEQTVGITTTIATGAYKPWTPNTAYGLGDNVNFQDGRNAVYRVSQAGTSAASGGGPSGKGSGIADGTVRWDWVNDAAINAKVSLYNEVNVVPGAGNTWAQANNIIMQPGVKPLFNVNTELDFTNNSGTDCVFGVSNCNGLYIRMGGSNKSTAGISIEGLGQSAQLGLRMVGPYSKASLSIDTSGEIGLAFNHLAPASYSVATISDQSTSPVALNLIGTNASASLRLAATSPVGLDMRDGHFSGAQILGTGFAVDALGSTLSRNLTVTGQIYETSPLVPPTSTTSCAPGQRSWDANFEYRCVAANTWKRAALSGF